MVAGGTDLIGSALVVADVLISVAVGAGAGISIGSVAGSIIDTAAANNKLW
jgi:hypothetical protein